MGDYRNRRVIDAVLLFILIFSFGCSNDQGANNQRDESTAGYQENIDHGITDASAQRDANAPEASAGRIAQTEGGIAGSIGAEVDGGETQAADVGVGNDCDECGPEKTAPCSNGRQNACVPDDDGCYRMMEVQCAGGVCIEGDRCAYIINRQWGGPRGNSATGVAFDSHGDIYVASSTLSGLRSDYDYVGTMDAALIKWNPRGQLVWARPWGSEQWDTGDDVIVDAQDRVFTVGKVGGELYGVPPFEIDSDVNDVGIVRTDANGAIEWSAVWGSNELDDPACMAFDKQGNLYVAGTSEGMFENNPNAGMTDIFLSKWSDEEKLWSRVISTEGYDSVAGIAVDDANNIYLAGSTDGEIPGQVAGGAHDGVLAKYSSDGELLWVVQWGGETEELFSAIAVVGSRIYLAGYINVEPLWSSSRGTNAFVALYDSDGNQNWLREWGEPDYEESVRGIVADADGFLYVCGEYQNRPGDEGPSASDNILYKLDADGQQLWNVRWGSPSWDGCSDMALGPDGLIATVGRAQAGYEGTFSTDTNGDGPALSLIRIQ
jgi:hypothetical protein